MTDVTKTLAFIKLAHAGQTYGAGPYWKHPVEVKNTGKKIFGSAFDLECQVAAILHDVVEDTKYTLSDLSIMGYSNHVVNAVGLLTKQKGLPYEDNIKRIINSGDKRAMMVKYSDNLVNFSGDKSDWDEKRREKSQKKYAWSLNTLGAKLGIKKTYNP
jgi:(p)ppGpp synthase/HD superfamily hydrolase